MFSSEPVSDTLSQVGGSYPGGSQVTSACHPSGAERIRVSTRGQWSPGPLCLLDSEAGSTKMRGNKGAKDGSHCSVHRHLAFIKPAPTG